MKKFMAVMCGTVGGSDKWEALDEKTRSDLEQKGIAAWGAWVEKNHKSIVDMGSPLGETLLINKKGVSSTVNELTAYTVVRAESHEEAAKLFLNHPHFMIFPGDRVEIMECLPIPGMPE